MTDCFKCVNGTVSSGYRNVHVGGITLRQCGENNVSCVNNGSVTITITDGVFECSGYKEKSNGDKES